jgi:hypothetical protein
MDCDSVYYQIRRPYSWANLHATDKYKSALPKYNIDSLLT